MHHAIDGKAIPRQHQQTIPGSESPRAHLARGSPFHDQEGLIRLEGGQVFNRPAAAPAGALLKKPAREHKAQQHHRLIEKTGQLALGPEPPHHAGQVGASHAQSHQTVHAGMTGQGVAESRDQNRAAGTGQGGGGDQSVKPGRLSHPQGAGPGGGIRLSPMAQAGEQHQHQRRHQLAPLLPPALLTQLLPAVERHAAFVPRLRLKSQAPEAGEKGLHTVGLWRQIHPGGAGEEIHTDLPHTWLLPQTLFHRPHAAAAFHALHIQKHTTADRWQGSHRGWGGRRCHGAAGGGRHGAGG